MQFGDTLEDIIHFYELLCLRVTRLASMIITSWYLCSFAISFH